MAGTPSARSGEGGAEWFKRAIGVRPILGAVGAGALMWVPSHKTGEALSTSVLFFVILAALRLFDPVLTPIWGFMAKAIPGVVRKLIGIGLPIFLAIRNFGPDAAGKEVATAKSSLIVATLVAYVFLRPSKEDAEPSTDEAPAPGPGIQPPPPPPPPGFRPPPPPPPPGFQRPPPPPPPVYPGGVARG